ncbi:MAG: YceI family protein [Actinomycetota bacterium]
MNKKALIAIVTIVVLAGGAFGARALFFGDPPEEASLATSVPEQESGDVEFEGSWTVDNTSGSLDAEPPTSTYAGYRISETFAGVGASIAVGRTQGVEGTMEIEGTSITDVDLTVDMTTLRSDKDMRDNALRTRGLQSEQYPTATFKLTEPIDIGSEPDAGEAVQAEATGDFTLHGVTESVTIPLEARASAGKITVVSSFDVDLDDYSIERPTTARVVSIADTGTVEMSLNFVKAA